MIIYRVDLPSGNMSPVNAYKWTPDKVVFVMEGSKAGETYATPRKTRDRIYFKSAEIASRFAADVKARLNES